MFDPLTFAKKLIDIPSPSEQERDAAVFLHDELARLGYDCRKQEVTAERFNVLAAAGRHQLAHRHRAAVVRRA